MLRASQAKTHRSESHWHTHRPLIAGRGRRGLGGRRRETTTNQHTFTLEKPTLLLLPLLPLLLLKMTKGDERAGAYSAETETRRVKRV